MNKIKLTIVMSLWGSIGLFTRFINLPSIQLAFLRAALSLPVLALIIIMTKRKSTFNKKSVIFYMLSGALIGFAWVALFIGYNYTSIASAVIIYNMCPVYVMIFAPLVLKEKRTLVQTMVIGISFIGLLMIVGTVHVESGEFLGLFMSAIAGLIYAVIVLLNRKMKDTMESQTATWIQMFSATLVLAPFAVHEGLIRHIRGLGMEEIVFVLILGVVHTGIAYSIYFSTYQHMKSIDIVSFSYLEPVFGILLSFLVLGERLTVYQTLGGILILGSTYFGEYIKARKKGMANKKWKLKEEIK